jgi:hypothetical protein
MDRAFCKRTHLPVMQPPLIDFAARVHHLESTQVLDSFMCALNGPGHGVLDGTRQCRFQQAERYAEKCRAAA